MIELERYALYVLTGLLAGSVTGIVGASGVVVTVPLLTLLGIDIHTAIGTSLLVDVLASVVVSFTYARAGRIRMREGLGMAIASVLGAQVGSRLAHMVPAVGMSTGFSVFLLLNGLLMWQRAGKGMAPATAPGNPRLTWRGFILSVLLGLVIGVVSGVFGAGGGIMILLVLVFALGYPLNVAVGTSTLIMAITALSGTIGYAAGGFVAPAAAIATGLGTIVAGRLAARFASRTSEATLGRAMGLLFTGLGVFMLVLPR